MPTPCPRPFPARATSIIFLILIALSSGAQQKADPAGYYISLTRDTISGTFPHYRETADNPTSILFLPKGASRPMVLVPDSCLAVSIDQSDKFIAYLGRRLTNSVTALDVEGDQPDAYADVSVFLRQLFDDGNFRLYELPAPYRRNFYISGDTLALQELYFKAYYEGERMVESPRFKQQLALLFRNRLAADKQLEGKLRRLEYNERDLLAFFHAAAGGVNKRVRDKYPPRIFIGLGVSANFFRVTLKDPDVPAVSGSFPVNFSPLLQFGVEAPMGRGKENWYFSTFLQAYTFNSNGSDKIGTATFKAIAINLPVALGYRLIKGPGASLGVTAGLSANFLPHDIHDGTYATSPPFSFHIDDSEQLNLTGLAGAELFLDKKLSFALHYLLPYKSGNYYFYTPKHSAVQLSVRYGL